MHLYMYIQIDVDRCIYVHTNIYYKYICAYICIYTYIYTHIHLHAEINE